MKETAEYVKETQEQAESQVGTRKKRGYDRFAHAKFLEELADSARKALKVPAQEFVSVYQDGVRLHWADECVKVAQQKKLSLFKCDAGYSPDTNPVENIFGIIEERLGKLQGKKRATSKAEHIARFKKVMGEVQEEGLLAKTLASMPKRCKLLIEAEGGPIKY